MKEITIELDYEDVCQVQDFLEVLSHAADTAPTPEQRAAAERAWRRVVDKENDLNQPDDEVEDEECDEDDEYDDV